MKRIRAITCIYAFLIALLLAPTVAHAENDRGLVLETGARVSIARMTLGGQFIEDSPAVRLPVHGIAAGIFAHLELFRWNEIKIGVQSELLYSPRGAETELGGLSLGEFRTRYLELPLLARIESLMLGPAAFYAAVGPTFNLLLTAESHDSDGTVSDQKEGVSKVDVGLATGVGTAIALSSRLNLTLEARYEHGFLTTDPEGEVEIQNRAILFTLGIGARFGADAPEHGAK